MALATQTFHESVNGGATTGNAFVTAPTRLVEHDIWLLFIETRGGQTIDSVTDWTFIAKHESGTSAGTDAGGSVHYHRYNGVDLPNFALGDSGNHTMATLIVTSGNADQFEDDVILVVQKGQDTTADTNTRGVGFDPTETARVWWVTFGGKSTGGSFSNGWENPEQVTNQTHHIGRGHSQGNAGSMFISSGRGTAASTSNWPKWTGTNSQEEARMVFTLRPHDTEDLARTATDSLTSADSASRTGVFKRSVTDALTSADSAIRTAIDFVRTATDALTSSDVAMRSVGLTRNITDALGASDVAVQSRALGRSIADSLTSADVALRNGVFGRTVADSVNLSEALSQIVFKLRTVTDAVGLADVATRTGAFGRTVTDGLTSGDVAARTGNFIRNATDSLSSVDVATRTGTFVRTAVDSLQSSDVAIRTANFIRAVSDSVTLFDSAVIPLWGKLTTFVAAAVDIIVGVFSRTEITVEVESATDIYAVAEMQHPDTEITTFVEKDTDITTFVE